jgi:hypothetical protein
LKVDWRSGGKGDDDVFKTKKMEKKMVMDSTSLNKTIIWQISIQ